MIASRDELVALEVAEAEESARVLELQGRALIDDALARSAEAESEAAAERAAICAEGAGFGGLVSVPTSQTERAEYRAREDARRLRRVLSATEFDQHRARIARMRQAVGVAARAMAAGAQAPGFRADYVAMVTLTYRDGADWEPRLHLNRFMSAVRMHCSRAGFSFRYVWVGELQARGALHYHVAIWLPCGVTLPKPDAVGWWPHGSTRIEAARDAVPYLMKYLSKGSDTSRLPKGARMHGVGGLEHAMRRAKRWLRLPAFVRARADVFDDWRPALGGGWCHPEGHVIPSEYVRAWLGDRYGCLRVVDYGRPFEASGPFTWLARRGEL